MKLKIRHVAPGDFGSYRCVAKNSLGETDGLIKLDGEKYFILFVVSYVCVSTLSFFYLLSSYFLCTEIPAPTTIMTTEIYHFNRTNGKISK